MSRIEDRDFAARDGIAGVDETLDLLIHELRNPIAVMKGFATSIQAAADATDPEAMKKAATAIHRSADRLDALLTSFSDVRDIDSGAFSIRPQTILLSEMLHRALEGLGFMIGDRRIRVHIEDDLTLNVDVVRIDQVIGNLVSNAAKFSPNGSVIEVTASRQGDKAHICVTDEGRGVPSELAHAIFEKFTRLNHSVGGSGIGLYLARGIARAHGGELELEDRNGRGCSFLLRLPVNREIALD